MSPFTNAPRCSVAHYAVIGGGFCNFIEDGVEYGFIGGGAQHMLIGHHAVIGGGECNYINSSYSTVAGGFCNTIVAPSAGIVAGECNILSAANGGIFAGSCNNVSGTFSGTFTSDRATVGGQYGFIATGSENIIDASTIHAFIGTGCNNIITNSAFGSSIVNGCNNTISSNNSTILGGVGNTIPAGMDDVVLFGNGLTATAPDMLFASQLNAINTPLAFGAYVAGTIFASATPPSPTVALPLYIKI